LETLVNAGEDEWHDRVAAVRRFITYFDDGQIDDALTSLDESAWFLLGQETDLLPSPPSPAGWRSQDLGLLLEHVFDRVVESLSIREEILSRAAMLDQGTVAPSSLSTALWICRAPIGAAASRRRRVMISRTSPCFRMLRRMPDGA